MLFMLVIYNDPNLVDTLPEGEYDGMMRECLAHADELRQEGHLIESRMLDDSKRARTVRMRNGRLAATDGPFAEVKEVLGGFNLIEAGDMDEAVRIAATFPWVRTGSVEIRPVQDIEAVRPQGQQPGIARRLSPSSPLPGRCRGPAAGSDFCMKGAGCRRPTPEESEP